MAVLPRAGRRCAGSALSDSRPQLPRASIHVCTKQLNSQKAALRRSVRGLWWEAPQVLPRVLWLLLAHLLLLLLMLRQLARCRCALR